MVVTTVTAIRTRTAFPTTRLPAMEKPISGKFEKALAPYKAGTVKTLNLLTPAQKEEGRLRAIAKSPLNLQAIVNPLTKVSLPGTTIPKTKVVVPLETKGIAGEIAKASTGFGIDVTRVIGSVNPLGGINPIALIGMFQDAFGKKTGTNVPKKGVNALNVQYSTAQKQAFKTASEVKLGQWYLAKSPTLMNTIAMMKTKSVIGQVYKSGYEFNPKGTAQVLQEITGVANTNAGLYESLYGKYLTETQQQTAYINELSGALQTLQASSVQGAIDYARLQETYQALLDSLSGGGGGNGNGTTPTDWKTLILYGALAIGGIIVLWALLKGRGK